MSREVFTQEYLADGWARAQVALGRWKSPKKRVSIFRHPKVLLLVLISFLGATLFFYEVRTSRFEARMLSALSGRMSFKLAPGPSASIVYPAGGPFNEIRGYAGLPGFQNRLTSDGFHITEQVRMSAALKWLSNRGITPPFQEPPTAGLTLRDENGKVLYDAARRERVFDRYEDIPPSIVKALLFVENRELDNAEATTQNPVVEWSRLGKAGLTYIGNKVGFGVRIQGGSTLATQIEKFRYADDGRTGSAGDKLYQMFSASLRVYRSGTDTRGARHEIVLDYLNSMPLASAVRYGEVYGLGNGLSAWFGIDLSDARTTLRDLSPDPRKERVFKQIVALICSARAPSFYLVQDRDALEARVSFYLRQLQKAGIISKEFAAGAQNQPLRFLPQAPRTKTETFVEQKATNAFRTHLLNMLHTTNLYTLDRLHLEADTTLNLDLQKQVIQLLRNLKNAAFVEANGLTAEHLLAVGDPAKVNYSFTIFERTPGGNLLRVQADTLNQPFDLNERMKLELGSTAKLRTLAHYLQVVSTLYRESHGLGQAALGAKVQSASDPITRWVAETMAANPAIKLSELIDGALDRTYSADPGETFFTGGGTHVFANFDREEDDQFYTVREGLYQSVNLVYIRLMRDLVRFHEARLPYVTQTVLGDAEDLTRRQLLTEIADQESREVLYSSFRSYKQSGEKSLIDKLLNSRSNSPRHLAMLFLAWHPQANAEHLAQFLESRGIGVSPDTAARLLNSYDPARLNISDYGFLLDRHPLEVWCAGELDRNPNISWNELLDRSRQVREISSRWLFQTKNRGAQDRRLRIRFEQDAFERMTVYWQRFGFPFDHLVPSLATAIGSSADRPIALAELVGIILNDGVRLPTVRISKLRFARNTPYETVFEPNEPRGLRVMEPEIAQALRHALAGIVQNGTARRLAGAFTSPNGKPIPVGGKTGSGDNRYETRNSSRAVSRTGTFAFYIGDRYFGVITAYVGGNEASQYAFTSALPVAALKLLAPSLIHQTFQESPELRHK